MKYEYLVLESDAAGVPAEMLNDQGQEGWKLCGITPKIPVNEEEGPRWIFYFVKAIDE